MLSKTIQDPVRTSFLFLTKGGAPKRINMLILLLYVLTFVGTQIRFVILTLAFLRLDFFIYHINNVNNREENITSRYMVVKI